MSLISVIVPVYKAEKYLDECIQSVLNQTYSDIELILVDDGSPDKSGEICDRYAENDDRIKVYHQQNGGVCAARNTGLDAATGEYIFFMDADDYLPDNQTLEVLHSDAVNNDADMAIGRVFSDSDGRKNELDNYVEIWAGNQGLINALEDNPILYGCCSKLFKAELVKDERFVVGRKAHEDGYFVFLALIKLPKISVRNRCTYVYRYNPDSASHAVFSDKYFDVLYFEELGRKKVVEIFPELEEKTYNKLVKAHLTMLHLFCTTKDKKYNNDIKKSVCMVRKFGKYFIPVLPGEKKFYLIVKCGGYPLFRLLYLIKYPLSAKSN